MAKFRGTKSLEFIDNQQLEGNIFELLDGAINALCHRRYDDYREGLQLGIYDDRVEICNPGRFPAGVTPENIKTLHASKPRNLHIAQVMYKAAYLEGWGTGITRMIDVCKAHNLPEPAYEIWADGTIALKELTDIQRVIIDNVLKDANVTIAQLAENLDVDERTIRRDITTLQKSGILHREG